MSLLGVDVGTTHCKVVLCGDDGLGTTVARLATPLAHDIRGLSFHPPETLWSTVVAGIRELGRHSDLRAVKCIGVASMAEAGLLVDAYSGEPRTEIVPWYDPRSIDQARIIGRADDPERLFQRSGLQPSYKYGLAKILWLRERDEGVTAHALWLSVADYVVFRLTGRMVTDPTLAARTYAFSLEDGAWDDPWVRHFGLSSASFPQILPAGDPAGQLTSESASLTGLAAGTPVGVCGHDHICAALAVGMTSPGDVVDSIGTAESMLGMLDSAELGQRGFDSGLKIVPHVLPRRFCWLGGIRSSGGAFEWVANALGDPSVTHDEALHLLQLVEDDVTGILFYPYLRGSGGVHSDDHLRAAFIGLIASHSRAHLLKAVLEGTAYESEAIRRAAQCLTDVRIDELVVVGGGAAIPPWLQIKADVTGCRCVRPDVEEATAVGAALLAGLGCGVLSSLKELLLISEGYKRAGPTVLPHHARHSRYRDLYETGYLPVSQALRQATRSLNGERVDHD